MIAIDLQTVQHKIWNFSSFSKDLNKYKYLFYKCRRIHMEISNIKAYFCSELNLIATKDEQILLMLCTKIQNITILI